jgi:hypothetical protein
VGKAFSASGALLGIFPVAFPKSVERSQPMVLDVTQDGTADLVVRHTTGTGRDLVFALGGAQVGEWDEATGKFFRQTQAGIVATGGTTRGYVLGSPAGRPATVFTSARNLTFAPFEAKFVGGAMAVALP